MDQLSLFDINFPVYAITKNYKKIWTDLNVVYIKTDSGIYVLDNKNIVGDTVGIRRLKINNSKLYIPRKVHYNIGQLLKSKHSIFMDKVGKLFKYKRTQFVPLTYHKIIVYGIDTDGECMMSCPNINFSYKMNCRKAYNINYVGLLNTKWGFIPYEFVEEYKKPTRRKI